MQFKKGHGKETVNEIKHDANPSGESMKPKKKKRHRELSMKEYAARRLKQLR